VIRPKATADSPEVPQAAIEVTKLDVPSSRGVRYVEGSWRITIKGPTGPQETTLVLAARDGTFVGEQSGQGVTSPITDVVVNGNELSWVNHVTKPIKMKVQFMGVVDGTSISGKVKAGFFGSFPFVGTKLAK
jgi:hypothetical protein